MFNDTYKTTTIEDTELIYTILREKYPDKQIKIDFSYDTKEYTLNVTKEDYTFDPNVPLNVTIVIIYGDTDSVFMSIKFNRKDFEQNRKDAFKLAIQCGDNITNDVFKRPPIDLEFEKVYQPFILLTKKRYIGKKYEDTRDPMKLKTLTTSGIAITKRNYCNMVKKCYKQVIDIIMDSSDLDEAISVYKKYIDRIDNYQIICMNFQ